VNGSTAKPATPVRVGDRVEAHVHGRERILEVVRLVDKRVGAPVAAECLVDHSPPPPPAEERVDPLFSRERGAGRPTKRERRDFDRFRRR
jgi:ribosome-associated heat shock protein Hsp15